MKNRRVLLKLMLAVSAFLVAACGNSSSGSNIQNRTDSEISDNSTYQPESMVEEEKILHSLMENDFEELYSLECSYYNETFLSSNVEQPRMQRHITITSRMVAGIAEISTSAMLSCVSIICGSKLETRPRR